MQTPSEPPGDACAALLDSSVRSSPEEGNVPVLGGFAGQWGDPNPCPCLPDPIPRGSLHRFPGGSW